MPRVAPELKLSGAISIVLKTQERCHPNSKEATHFFHPRKRERERDSMKAMGFWSSSTMLLPSPATRNGPSSAFSPLLIQSMATQKPNSTTRGGVATKKGSAVFPLGEQGPRNKSSNGPPIKLLTRVEQLRLLTKAEKAGLLSAAEGFGLSLSTVEKLGLLSKAEELGVLSAATDPGTPGAFLTLSIGLLLLGPLCVYVVPEKYAWEVVLQVVVALISVVGGSAAFAASNFVSNLQKSS